MKPFRFSVELQNVTDAGEWRHKAQRIEELSYRACDYAQSLIVLASNAIDEPSTFLAVPGLAEALHMVGDRCELAVPASSRT